MPYRATAVPAITSRSSRVSSCRRVVMEFSRMTAKRMKATVSTPPSRLPARVTENQVPAR